jgi:hypothetical protein
MPRLTVTEFNTPEFFGYGGNRPGGYGRYQPVHYSVNPAYCQDLTNDEWYRRGQEFVSRGGLVGLKVLELGCAFGSLVRHLRSLGANAYGLDLSWPISQGIALWPELEPYLIVAEAVAWLQSPARVRNEYEAVISRGFLDCLSDAELAVVIPRINFISKKVQIHAIDPTDDPEYYNTKTLAQWRALGWEAGTLILDDAN